MPRSAVYQRSLTATSPTLIWAWENPVTGDGGAVAVLVLVLVGEGCAVSLTGATLPATGSPGCGRGPAPARPSRPWGRGGGLGRMAATWPSPTRPCPRRRAST